MKTWMLTWTGLLLAALGHAAEPVVIEGAACTPPPWLHCPDQGCAVDRVINQGPVVEMETRRT